MTAQISDRITWRDEEYSVVATSRPIEFNPFRHGFHPVSPSTACWDGFWCEYLVTDEALLLDTLHIFHEDGRYPEFHGVKPYIDESDRSPMAEYSGLNFPIDYSGRIVSGGGFLSSYYLHRPHQRAWAYEHVVELTFEHGRVTECADHSEFVAQLREAIKRSPADFYFMQDTDMIRCLEESFPHDPRVRAWWLQ